MSMNGTNISDCNANDGTITINTLNPGNYQYSIDSGITWQANNNLFISLSTGNYPIAISNADTTCIVYASNITITEPIPPIITNVVSTNPTFCSSNSGSIIINTPSGSNYDYSIDGINYFQTSNFTNLACGSYTVSVRNSNGTCIVNYANNPVIITGYVPSTYNIYDTIAIGATHKLCLTNNLVGASASLTNTCGIIPNVAIDSLVNDCLYLYADNYGSATTCFVRCDNLGYCDTTYLHFTVIDGVWPGDADDNTNVNNFDLLNIGLAYGTTGTTRDSISNRWNGFLTPLWNQVTPTSNIDYRHLDCNGDGIINSDDTTAIVQNYNLSYQRGGGGSNTGTPLMIDIDPNYTLPHFSLPITLGDIGNPTIDVFGGAFSILYDTSLIKKDSVFITFNNSWVGTKNVDMISLQKNFGDQQQIDVAFTRIDGTNITGFGEIGQLNFTIKDDILQRGTTVDSVIFNFNIVNTKFITAGEQEIDIATQTTSWVVTETESVPNLAQFVNVFPNPANNYVQIESSSLPIDNIVITDAIGRIVLQKATTNKYNTALDINHLKQGVYNIQLKTERGTLVKRLVVLK